jgi:hypothetical protein
MVYKFVEKWKGIDIFCFLSTNIWKKNLFQCLNTCSNGWMEFLIKIFWKGAGTILIGLSDHTKPKNNIYG